jgi:hypothetical protein
VGRLFVREVGEAAPPGRRVVGLLDELDVEVPSRLRPADRSLGVRFPFDRFDHAHPFAVLDAAFLES